MRLPERHSSPPEAPSDQNTVFISYSRTDMAFADELVAGLEMFGSYDVTIDRSDIRTGEEWQARLGALIADADTVVFILSPASVAAGATVIEWEIREAERLSKRILPVLAEPVNDAAVPASLGKLQRVDFTAGSFLGALRKLRDALDTDIDWISWHTYYARRAREWAAADHAANRLLLGGDIEAAQKWLQEPPKGAPEPTELHRSFIQASVEAQVARLSTERKRAEQLQRLVIRTRMALAVTVVLALAAIGAGAYAYFQQGKVLAGLSHSVSPGRRFC